MDKKRIKKAAELIRGFLNGRNIEAEKIILFGSYAKGNYTPDSDIDIAIVSKEFNGKDIFQKAEMLTGLQWFITEKLAFPFDIIPLSFSEWKNSSSPLVDFVREGKPV